MMLAPTIDPAIASAHRRRNRMHTLLLGVAAVLLLSVTAWSLDGWRGVLWAGVGGTLSVLFAARLSSGMARRLYGAREMTPASFPEAHRIVQLLSGRAGLSATPRLYRVSSRLMNAFSAGTRADSVICVTDGLLARMAPREFVGVMAHEIAHIVHEDIHVMAMADVVSRMTGMMSLLGLLLAVVNLPAMIGGGTAVPWATILLLLVAPSLGTGLQLALSRAREYEADLGAAALTGDPEGLALALLKLERMQGHVWEAALPPGARIPDPSILRSHPRTEERVRRLRTLQAVPARWLDVAAMPHVAGHSLVPSVGAPRRRLQGFGVWY